MAGNNQGPWGGGGGNNGDDDRDRDRQNGGGRRPGEPQIPEFDEIVSKTRDQLRVLMGGGGGNGRSNGSGGGAGGPQVSRGMIGIGALLLAGIWAASSFYTVKPEERSVELFLGECMEPCVGQPGLNFAPWPLVTHEIVEVSQERVIQIGKDPIPNDLSQTDGAAQRSGPSQAALNMLEGDTGLMLTGDENVVDIDFQVVWNITEPDQYLFNLAEPEETITAVAESAMREIIAQSLLEDLNPQREVISDRLQEATQRTLDSYNAGVNVVRINLDGVDPPATLVDVINIDGQTTTTSPLAAYRDVQDAEQERIQLQNNAEANANRVTARARGNAAQTLQDAEAYRAQVVNGAQGDAARFVSVLEEYQKAPEVTRERLYLEMIEEVFGRSDIILLDDAGGGGSGVVPYLPLDQLRGGSN